MASQISKILEKAEVQNSPATSDDFLHRLLQSLSPQQQIALLQTLDSNVLLAALQQRLKVPEAASSQTASEPATDDKRRAKRRRVLLGAKIVYNGRLCVIHCHIRDISDTGCRLKVSNTTVTIPNRFTLEFAEGDTSRECEVTWRREDTMGVRFLTQ